MMTADEFLRDHAQKNGMTVEGYRRIGIVAVPCTCGLAGCPGWTLEGKQPPPDHFRDYHLTTVEILETMHTALSQMATSIDHLCVLLTGGN